jgi:hypothetical protein
MKFKLFAATLLLIASVYGATVFSESSATPATNNVTVNWTTISEESVSRFIVLRSTDDRLFAEIGSVNVQGTGVEYKFVDNNVVFKGSQTFFYKIRAVNTSGGTIDETQSLMVNPNISGMFRTWGAIKLMFR